MFRNISWNFSMSWRRSSNPFLMVLLTFNGSSGSNTRVNLSVNHVGRRGRSKEVSTPSSPVLGIMKVSSFRPRGGSKATSAESAKRTI
jgi:hypothetical protein